MIQTDEKHAYHLLINPQIQKKNPPEKAVVCQSPTRKKENYVADVSWEPEGIMGSLLLGGKGGVC